MFLNRTIAQLAAGLGLAAAIPVARNVPAADANKIERKRVAARPKRDWRRARWAPPGGGASERARRRAQIARGQLTESNGLLRSAGDQP